MSSPHGLQQPSYFQNKDETAHPIEESREHSLSREVFPGFCPPKKQPHLEENPTDFAEKQYLTGLAIAGLASSLLSTTFNLFHFDTFLTAYQLPLGAYARGNIIYTGVNTVNDLIGAWFVDSHAVRSSRSSIVGITGYVFCMSFLTPFFRWGPGSKYSSRAGDAAHFAFSMSLYDTMYGISTILYGSMFTDYHHLDEKARVMFMASGNVVNMLASYIVAWLGMSLYSTENLSSFRYFVVVLSSLSCILFVIAQQTMPQRRGKSGSDDDMNPHKMKPKRKLYSYQVFRDFVTHKNFRMWIISEMLLKSQVNFSSLFLKTFVDHLLLGSGLSKEAGEMILTFIPPACQIAAICLYVPILQRGYQRMYMDAFKVKLILSSSLLVFGSSASVGFVSIFFVVDLVLSSAMQSSGFYLAMGDLVAEMKVDQIKVGRFNEPSLAGLFMGANALLCKPATAFLPQIAAWSLAKVGFSNDANAITSSSEVIAGNDKVRSILFYLLVLPSFVFSIIQIIAWSKFDLDEYRAREVKTELKALQEKQDNEDHLRA